LSLPFQQKLVRNAELLAAVTVFLFPGDSEGLPDLLGAFLNVASTIE
jgi:hypothetical protein